MKRLLRQFTVLILISTSMLALLPGFAAAAPNQQSVTTGQYTSEALISGEAEGQTLYLELSDDGTALLEYVNDADEVEKVELGEWSEKDSQLLLTITGSEDEEYDEAIEITFAVAGDTLIANEYDTDLFGDVVIFTLDGSAEAGDETAAESFTFESVDGTDADGNEIKVSLTATGVADGLEGEITLTTENADGDVLEEFGTWSQADEDSNEVVISITGTADEEYDEPVELTLLIDDSAEVITLQDASGERYSEDGVTLELNIDMSEQDSGSSEDDTSTPPGIYYAPSLQRDADGNLYAPLIELTEIGDVQWNTNYFGGSPAMSEIGVWTMDEDGKLTITITGVLNGDGEVVAHDKPIEVAFEFSYDSLNNYDLGLYMFKLSLPYDETDGSSDSSSEDTTSDDSGSEVASTPIIFESGELADGSSIRIEFAEDGTANVVTTFSNGDDDLVEVAEWSLDEGTDEMTLTVTGTADENYDEPIEWIFDAAGDVLTAVDWDSELYGEDAPEFEQIEE